MVLLNVLKSFVGKSFAEAKRSCFFCSILSLLVDGCVWDPEMYELWGSGGAPFKKNKDGTLNDRSG